MKADVKITRKAFHEPRGENKMKTRQNDLDKLKDRELDSKVRLVSSFSFKSF